MNYLSHCYACIIIMTKVENQMMTNLIGFDGQKVRPTTFLKFSFLDGLFIRGMSETQRTRQLECKVHVINSSTRWCTLVYVQVSESCHTLHLRSQSGHIVMLASQTSFLQQDKKPRFTTSSLCVCM